MQHELFFTVYFFVVNVIRDYFCGTQNVRNIPHRNQEIKFIPADTAVEKF